VARFAYRLHPYFESDLRYLRLGFANDGMPYGNLNNKHSVWLVLLIVCNLSYWMCIKGKYMMLSIMTSRSRQPINDIDVYLTLLIKDLRLLMEDGV